MLRKIILLFVLQYRKLSAVLPANCRFYPSCSAYALNCIHNSNLTTAQAIIIIVKRLIKCHPFHEGGVDDPPMFYQEKCLKEGNIKSR